MVEQLAQALPQIIALCRKAGVQRLWLYGSATGRSARPFTDTSDVDLLVEFGSEDATARQGWNHPLFVLPGEIENAIGRPVHVTENVNFRNPFFREEVLRTRELIYDAAAEEASVGHR